VDDVLQRVAAALPDIARRAGNLILEIQRQGIETQSKADGSPVTRADREAEALIDEALAVLDTDWSVIGEEAHATGNDPRQVHGPFFLVDALDGTREFVAGRDEFTVNIALVVNGAPRLGVVHQPVTGETWWTDGDGAAWADGPDTPAHRITAVPPDEAGLRVVASRSHRHSRLDGILERLNVRQVRHYGSSLKLVALADGRADLYPRLSPTMAWDIAAGHAVLNAADGGLTLWDGRPLTYDPATLRNPPFVAYGGIADPSHLSAFGLDHRIRLEMTKVEI
jgi:3'(2'), 5'-bisphosphate nucleotidase